MEGIVATYGIDDRPANRAMARVEGRAKASVGLVEREMGRASGSLTAAGTRAGVVAAGLSTALGAVGMVARRSLGYAASAMRSIGDESESAAHRVGAVGRAVDDLQRNIGRQLGSTWLAGQLPAMVAGANELQSGAWDAMSRLTMSRDAIRARRAGWSAEREEARGFTYQQRLAPLQIGLAEAQGQTAKAQLLGINAEHAARTRSIRHDGSLTDPQRSEMLTLADRTRDEARARVMRDLRRAVDEEGKSNLERLEGERRALVEEEARYKLQTMRLRGMDEEVERAEAVLETEKRIAAIEAGSLAPSERASAVGTARAQLADRLAAMDAQPSGARRGPTVLAAGLGTTQNIRQVFGPGPATDRVTKSDSKTHGLLAQIRDAVHGGRPATFSP